MIEHLMIITEAGIPIFFRSYSNIEINHILISGFLTAIDEWAKTGMNSALKQVQLDDRYITIKRKELPQGDEVRFILVHQHCLGFRRQEDCMCVPTSLEEISSEFFSRFINTNYTEFESSGRKLAHPASFPDFDDFIDSVIKQHFLNHSNETGFTSDIQIPDLKELSNQKLLGAISFINDQLFKFYLNPTFSSPKFHKLIKLAGIWSELLGNDKSVPSFPILELKDFRLASSNRISKNNEKVTIFSLWMLETSTDTIRRSHNHLCNILVSESNIVNAQRKIH